MLSALFLVTAWVVGTNSPTATPAGGRRLDWDLPPLMPTVFPSPTGNNGAEEYVQAMDFLRAKHFDAYSDWQAPEFRPPGGSINVRSSWDPNTTSDRRYIDLITRLDTLSPLAFRSEVTSIFRPALDLVKRGNGKPATFPDGALKFRFPPVGETMYLVKLATDAAYVELSEGRSNAATDDLVNAAVYLERMSSLNYMQTRVGIIGRQNLITTFARNMDRFSLADCGRFEDLANRILGEPPGFLAAFKKDVASEESQVPTRLADLRKQAATEKAAKELVPFAQLFGSTSDGEMAQLSQQIVAGIQSSADIALKRFAGPETSWLPETNVDSPDQTQLPPKSLQDLVAYLAQAWSPPLAKQASSIQRDMQSRAEIRLLRIATRILEFRWVWDRLPSNIGEMKLPAEYLYDPLSKEAFVYEPKGSTFRLYSKGWKGKGEVDFFNFPGQGGVQGARSAP